MRVEVTDKLVSAVDESVLGFLVSAGGQYKVAVTKDFGVEHEIGDIDIAQWLDVPEVSVVPCGRKSYGVCDKSLGFNEEFQHTPVEDFGGMKFYYGYIIKEQAIVPMDSELAYERMLRDARGEVIE